MTQLIDCAGMWVFDAKLNVKAIKTNEDETSL